MPSVKREIRNDLTENAELKAIDIFQKNMDKLLMQQPIKKTAILGIDPGIRTGSKAAAVDPSGKLLGYFTFDQKNEEESIKKINSGIKDYNVKLIAIGNGTGSRDVQYLADKVIKEKGEDYAFTVVEEDGASVYSASEIAREEFPDLDLTIRGVLGLSGLPYWFVEVPALTRKVILGKE